MKNKQLIVIPIAAAIILAAYIAKPFHYLVASFLGITLYFLFILLLVRKTDTFSYLIKQLRAKPIPAIIITCAAIAFSGFYFSLYHFIPIWDSIGYWSQTLSFNQSLKNSVLTTIRDTIGSVNTQDYNLLQCWIASFPVMLFPTWVGAFFSEYILAFIPSALLLSGFVSSHINKMTNQDKNSTFVLTYIFSLCIPVATRPIFTGYLDGYSYLLFIALITVVFDGILISSRFTAFLTGLALIGTFLLRRWFIFGIIGLTIAVTMYWIMKLFYEQRNLRLQYFKTLLLTVLIMLSGAAIPLITLFRGFIIRSTSGNYSASYQGWTLYPTITEKIFHYSYDYGIYWLLLATVSIVAIAVYWLKHRISLADLIHSSSSALIWLVSIIQIIVTLVAFWRVQDFSPQHWYTIFPFVFIVTIFPTLFSLSLLTNAIAKRVISLFLVLLSVMGLCSGFSLIGRDKTWNYLLGNTIQSPFKQSDVAEKQALIKYLTTVTQQHERVYFAAASANINGTLALSVNLPYKLQTDFPVSTADVDLRDGFNTEFFDSSYIVTSTPTAYHMKPDNEKVVGTLNELVTDSQSFIGQHYSKEQSFQFENNYTVTVYKRNSKESKEDIKKLQAIFNDYYPNNPELFNNRFEEYLKNIK